MPEDKQDPLNPNTEQRLFEKLSLSKSEQDEIDTIRRLMKHIIKTEQHEQCKQDKSSAV